MSEVVQAMPRQDEDRHYHVRVKTPFLAGTQWREKGQIVRLPERVAREVCQSGAADPHGLTAAAAMWLLGPDVGAPAPQPKPQEGSDVVFPPNIQLVQGSLFQDGRSYTKDDGPFYFKGDVLRLLALQDPMPGSPTAQRAMSGSRRPPVIKCLAPLSEAAKRRLASLRVNLDLEQVAVTEMRPYPPTVA
jgi:hypothetical protein